MIVNVGSKGFPPPKMWGFSASLFQECLWEGLTNNAVEFVSPPKLYVPWQLSSGVFLIQLIICKLQFLPRACHWWWEHLYREAVYFVSWREALCTNEIIILPPLQFFPVGRHALSDCDRRKQLPSTLREIWSRRCALFLKVSVGQLCSSPSEVQFCQICETHEAWMIQLVSGSECTTKAFEVRWYEFN